MPAAIPTHLRLHGHDGPTLARLTGLPIATTRAIAVGDSTRTDEATLEDGRVVVVQRLAGRATAPLRIATITALVPRLTAAGIPVPAVSTADASARPPFIVTDRVDGEPGIAALLDADRAPSVARQMGRLARAVASVPTDGLRLPGAWAHPQELASVARRWLSRAAPLLPAEVGVELDDLIASLPDLFGGRPAVLAHGDWAPVNVIVQGRAVAGVVDWEFARLADPLFDIAWWGALVFVFHPDAWPIAWPAFLEGAGIELDAGTVARLRSLASLRALEALGSRRVLRDPREADAWARRLVRLLDR